MNRAIARPDQQSCRSLQRLAPGWPAISRFGGSRQRPVTRHRAVARAQADFSSWRYTPQTDAM